MTITEKLIKLTENKNKAELARKVGLKSTIISDYIARGYTPRADIALKMARALEVPVEWLIDDGQETPPPSSASIASLSTDQLVAELGNRMRGIGLALFAKLARAQRINWAEIANELMTADPEKELPKRLKDLVALPVQIITLMADFNAFDPHFSVGADTPPEILKEIHPSFQTTFQITLLELTRMFTALDQKPSFSAAQRLLGLWFSPKEWRGPSFPEHVKYQRERAAAELAAEAANRKKLRPLEAVKKKTAHRSKPDKSGKI